MKFGVIVFPGAWSNGDFYHALDKVLAQPVSPVCIERPASQIMTASSFIVGITNKKDNVLGIMPPERD